MDITTVVVVLVLIALSLGAITWMEIHSRKNSSKKRGHNAKSSDLKDKKIAEQHSPFISFRLNEAASGKNRAQKKAL